VIDARIFALPCTEPRSSARVLSVKLSSDALVGSTLKASPIRIIFQGYDPAKPDPLPEFLLHPRIQTNSSSRIRVGFLGHNEAYCEDNYLVGGYLCRVDWSPGDVCSSTKSDLLPIYFIVSLGCYGLLMVGIGLMHFPTCPQEAVLLQQDIVEAKDFLKQRGVDVSSE
ncbi:hypothetical protein EUGRSUZ_K03282, partial [Eucalyptus grandis]